MAYDYTLGFLERRKEDIKVIETCYTNRTPFSQTFDYPNEAARARVNISNVLRSLALHYPDQYKHVRQVVRTRIDPLPTGKWRLTIYPAAPGEKIEGRPPGQATRTSWEGMQAREAVIGDEHRFPEIIKDGETWTRFVEASVLATKEVKRMIAELSTEPSLEDLEQFTELFGLHDEMPENERWRAWKVSMNGPTTLVLERA